MSGEGGVRPRRVLQVLVPGEALADGLGGGHLAVGRIVSWGLLLLEVRSGVDDAGVTVLRAHAQPVPTGVLTRGTLWHGPSQEQPWWLTVLHGDGWEAMWRSPGPVVGEVEVRGTLTVGMHGFLPTSTRGRVTRAAVITKQRDRAADDSPYALRDVEVAPRWLDDLPSRGTAGGSLETGLLVDLDLDDVPRPPLRPSFVPATVAADGADLWAVDPQLSAARRVRNGAVVQRVSWAAPVRARPSHHRLVADAGGLWVAGPGLRRVHLDGTVHRHLAAPVWHLAAGTGQLAVHVVPEAEPASLQLRASAGEVTTLPVDHDVRALVAGPDDAFLLLLAPHRSIYPPPPDRRPWLARLHRDSGLTHGTRIAAGVADLPILLGGPHPVLLHEGRVNPVTVDLTLGPAKGPNGVRGGTSCPDRLWLFAESSVGNGTVILTGHVHGTLEERSRHVLPGMPDDVVTTDDGLWVRVNGLLLHTSSGRTTREVPDDQ